MQRASRRLRAIGVLALGSILLGGVASAKEPAPEGARLYRRHCLPCHGVEGRGNGPDAELYRPPPRDLRSGFLQRYETEALVKRVREGAPLKLGLDLGALRAHAESVEAIAAHLERLPGIDWRSVEAGIEVYIDRCELCHGAFGRPPDTLPSGVQRPRDLSDPAWQRKTTDAEIQSGVRHGRDGMPALLPPLAPGDTQQVAAFVRLLSPGYEEYSRYCAACHGDDGRGDGGFSESFARPTVSFDRAYFARRDPEEVRGAIWHMAAEQKPGMPHLRGTLTVREARAIIEHLKALPAAKN